MTLKPYLAEIAHSSGARAEDVRARIGSPMLAALLVAKIAVAAEEGITLVVTEDSHLDVPDVDAQALITIIGNLTDNSIDALRRSPSPREITVRLTDHGELRIEVSDTGPGVAHDAVNELFVDGYTTKPGRGTVGRGLGLALVHRIVKKAGGRIDVSPGPGARFVVVMPLPAAAAVATGQTHDPDVGRRRRLPRRAHPRRERRTHRWVHVRGRGPFRG